MVTDRNGATHRPAGSPAGGQFSAHEHSAPTSRLSIPDDADGEGYEVAVSPVGFEEQWWAPKVPQLYSRAEVVRQTGSYSSTITPEIADLRLSIPTGLAADAEDAARALTDFDSYAQRTLGTDDPALGPMSAILLRTESASSSQIEMLTTSAKQLALAEIDEGDKQNALEVVGNVRAMEAALALSERIDADSILDMHRELLRSSRSLGAHAGRFREELVWIGKGNAGPREASFVAQQHPRVPGSISDLVAFARRADLPVIPHVAITHAQFETIHPFVDGNGRTGRALAQSMLRNLGVTRHTTIPVSAGLLVNTESYFDALSAYREGDAGPIIARFSEASRYAASSGRELVDGLGRQLDESREMLSGLRRQSRAWDVLPLLIGQPVVNSSYLKRVLGFNDMTVARSLDALTERGVLVERSGMRRNRVWEHRGILGVLDEYAEQIRRATIG